MWKLIPVSLCMIACASGAMAQESVELQPQDFASGFSIEGAGLGEPLYSLELPAEVMLGTAWADLRDIRVFNAQSQSLPLWLRPLNAQAPQAQTAALKLFVLPPQGRQNEEGRVVVRTDQGQVEVAVPFADDSTPQGASYLLEVPESEDYRHLSRMRFAWQRGAENWRGVATLSGGYNLTDWYEVASGALADLKAGDDSLRVDELSLSYDDGYRYYLLQFDSAAAPTLSGASLIYYDDAVPAEPLALDMAATRISATEYEFSLPHALAVSALRIALPEPNTVASAVLSTRAAPDEAWRTLGTSALYRLQEYGAGTQMQPDVDTAGRTLQTVRVVAQGPGWGEQAPTMTALVERKVLVFNARGSEPFLLAFGARAASGVSTLSDQIPGLSGGAAFSDLPQAFSGAPVKLGGPERLIAQSPAERSAAWTKALLWIVLIAGAGTLAWFALRLVREVRVEE